MTQMTRTNHVSESPLPPMDREAVENRKVRETLDVIDNVLCGNDGAAWKLWDVLSALRGPDTGNFVLKRSTTAPIRRVAFPKFAKVADERGSFGPSFRSDGYERPSLDNPAGPHFYGHIRMAAAVLGLDEEY